MALSETDVKIYRDIRDWVAEETRLKGEKGRFVPRTRAHAQNEYESIVHERLPEAWSAFQELRVNRLPERSNASLALRLKIGQQVLTACALAEESLAFDAITKGIRPIDALHQGFNKMDKYVDNLRQVQKFKLPQTADLGRSLDSVVGVYNGNLEAYEQPIPRLQTIVGLAIVAIHEQTKDHVLLPTPGHKPGDVELWSQPRLHQAEDTAS